MAPKAEQIVNHLVPVLVDNIATIAAHLIGATTTTGNLADYFTKENGVPTRVNDQKLLMAVQIAKRLVELSKN